MKLVLTCGVMLVAFASVFADAAPVSKGLKYTRSAENMNWNFKREGRAIPKVKIYAERQPYTPNQNFLNRWIDRPLFTDVSLRSGDREKNGFLKDVEIAKQYGLDGFAAIAYPSLHSLHLQYLEQAKVKDYEHAYVISSGELGPNSAEDSYQYQRNVLMNMGKSPYTARINGKMLCFNYGGIDSKSRNFLQKTITRLRADPEIPPFLIIAQLPFLNLYNSFNENMSKGRDVPRKDIEKFRAEVREALTVFDGLQLRCWEASHDPQGEYPWRIMPTLLYKKYLLPVLREEFAKPEHRGKLLGLYPKHAYINIFHGTTNGQYGTEQLRTYFGEASKLSPDVIVLFEWNEANENTSFQPTVSSGRALERLIAYARSSYDGTTPAPRPGDDTSVPNLVLSVQQSIRLGEILHIELLNIPDGTSKEIQTVLTLSDGEGNKLCELPAERFDASKLRAVTWRFPAEQLSKVQAVNYELTVTCDGKKKIYRNFDATRVETTSNIRYLSSRMPLREALAPVEWNLNAVPEREGGYLVDASFEGTEELASLEILDGNQELYSLDCKREFDTDKEAVFRGTYTIQTPQQEILSGRLSVPGVENWHLRSLNRAWEIYREGIMIKNEMRVKTYFGGNKGEGGFILGVPLSDMKNKPVFTLKYKGFPEISFDLDTVFREGRQTKLFANSVLFDLRRADTLSDYPEHLNAKSGKIHTVIRPVTLFPQLQLRAISKSGKIFRSPVRSLRPASGADERMSLWSETKKRPLTVDIPSDRIPDINAIFDPSLGLAMATTKSPEWNITLGGGWTYADPMEDVLSPGNSFLPKDFTSCNPEWIQKNGKWMLKFNGKGNYMILQKDMIPRAASFTLEFEIKRDGNNNEGLLRTGSCTMSCGLELFIANGVLKGLYADRQFAPLPKYFDTGLKVPVNVWTKISIVKTAEKLTFSVDGKSKSYDFTGRGAFFSASAFGAPPFCRKWLPEDCRFFSGTLRSMHVRHNVNAKKK